MKPAEIKLEFPTCPVCKAVANHMERELFSKNNEDGEDIQMENIRVRFRCGASAHQKVRVEKAGVAPWSWEMGCPQAMGLALACWADESIVVKDRRKGDAT